MTRPKPFTIERRKLPAKARRPVPATRVAGHVEIAACGLGRGLADDLIRYIDHRRGQFERMLWGEVL